MTRKLLQLAFFAACLAGLVSCTKSKPANVLAAAAVGPSDTAELIAAGPQMDAEIAYQFAIYYLPQPTTDPLAKLDELLPKYAPFVRAEQTDNSSGTPQVAARIEADSNTNYTPPSIDSLKYSGRGLSREQAEALQTSQAVLIIDFAYSREHVWSGLRSATQLVHELAVATGGLAWDDSTREVFTPQAWQERRLSDWTDPLLAKNDVPQISNHTTIHAYRKDEFVRAITLGMEKFGLPDLVVEDFPWSRNTHIGHVINMLSQALAEGAEVPRPGEFDLDFRQIQNASVREPQLESLAESATGVALLTLRKGVWEQGDPMNELIKITFERGAGPDKYARLEHVLATAFGAEDPVTQIRHDEAIKAASRQARAKLPALRADFEKGLEPGERLEVKVPFNRPDGGEEWMWVEISRWEGDKITGLLQNDPYDIPTLHAGQMVVVSEAKVFDYIRRRPDGTKEGNETGKLIAAKKPE